jgi:hypothetical protein
MRQLVVIITTTDLRDVVPIWAALVGGRIVCVMPPRALTSPRHLRLAQELVRRVVQGTNIVPVWPWISETVSER